MLARTKEAFGKFIADVPQSVVTTASKIIRAEVSIVSTAAQAIDALKTASGEHGMFIDASWHNESTHDLDGVAVVTSAKHCKVSWIPAALH